MLKQQHCPPAAAAAAAPRTLFQEIADEVLIPFVYLIEFAQFLPFCVDTADTYV